MSETSIQVRLAAEQLRRLGARARTEGRTLPDVIREAIEMPGREECAGRTSPMG